MRLAEDIIVNHCPCHFDGSGFHTIPAGTDLKIVAPPPEYAKHMADALRRGDECICVIIGDAIVRVPKRKFQTEEDLEWMLEL